MISSSVYLFPILGFALKATAQCVTAGYVPCLVPGANIPAAPVISPYGGGSFGGGGSGFWSSVSGVATDPIQFGGDSDSKRDLESRSPSEDGYTEIEKRQNSLCCRPAPVECLYTDGIPFCYNPTTTRLYFSDGSIAYVSNDTYYGSDGTFIDYKNGIYEYPNGTVVDFTPDGSAATTSAGTGSEPTSAAVVESSSAVKGTATGSSAKVTATPVTGGAIGTGTTTSSGSTATSSHNAAAGKTKPGVLVAALGMAAALL